MKTTKISLKVTKAEYLLKKIREQVTKSVRNLFLAP